MCVSAVSVLSLASLCQRTIQRMSSQAPLQPLHTQNQPRKGATLPSHPTPNQSNNPCILQFRLSAVVSVLVELCDVGGKRLMGWGQLCGMLLLREVGWGVQHRLGQKTKRAQGLAAFFLNAGQ